MDEKFIITWNIGYGDNHQVVNAENIEDAQDAAYEAAKEDFEASADYGATPWTKERAEELGLEDE